MKRILALALAASMFASLAGCGGKDSGTASSIPPREENSGNFSISEPAKTPAPAGNGLDASSIKVTNADFFQNGRALIQFKDEVSGDTYNGLIDADGKLLSYLNGKEAHFVDGYIYYKTDGTLYVFDRDFTLLTSYSLKEKESVEGWGGGYFVIRSPAVGFDATASSFCHFFDSTGKEFASPADVGGRVVYLGKGVFRFDGYAHVFYFTQSDTWLEQNRQHESHIMCNSFGDKLVVYSDNPPQFSYADEQGSSQTISVPEEFGAVPFYVGEANGRLLFQDLDFLPPVVYDTQSGQFKQYQGSYQMDVIQWRIVFKNGMFLVPVRGGDGNTYSVLLNSDLEELCGPVLGGPGAIMDDCFYTADGTVYTFQGEELAHIEGNFDSMGEDMQPWHDGGTNIIAHRGQYFRSDGSELTIDFSTGKLVTLPE